MNRSKARELAFKLIYEKEIHRKKIVGIPRNYK